MKTVFEITKGMEVWMEPTGNNARMYSGKPWRGEVTSIGRKYFYVSTTDSRHWRDIKFEIDTFRCLYDDNAGFILYPSYEAFVAEKTRRRKIMEIESAMQYARNHNDIPGAQSIPTYETIDSIYQLLRNEGLVPEWKEGMMYGCR